MKNNYIHKAPKISKVLQHAVLIMFCAACVFPILLVLVISFSKESDLYTYGYNLIPRNLDFQAYKVILKNPTEVLNAYKVTIIVTLAGTVVSLWLTSTLAYVMSRKDFIYSRHLSFYVFFTMLFSGGLVPFYLLVSKYLHLKDTIFALFIPYLIVPWFVLLMKGFFNSTPLAIIESAKIDGAGELRTFVQIILPISKPALATVGLFIVLMYWNDWWLSLLFINGQKPITLQFMLYRIMSSIEFLTSGLAQNNPGLNAVDMPSQSARMAMCVLAAGPMLFVFPFFQKYFVRGLTVGSVKG